MIIEDASVKIAGILHRGDAEMRSYASDGDARIFRTSSASVAREYPTGLPAGAQGEVRERDNGSGERLKFIEGASARMTVQGFRGKSRDRN